MESIADREAAIAQIAESGELTSALREHVHEIIEGEAFRGSNRCKRFLTYIVEHAISAQFESLKERVIGLELFGRCPSYDTKEDAIVRVTASDVRKRLLQHYGRAGLEAPFRISLPSGSYIPEIVRTPPGEGRPHTFHPDDTVESLSASTVVEKDSAPSTVSGQEVLVGGTSASINETGLRRSRWRRWSISVAVFAVLNLSLWGVAWRHSVRSQDQPTLPLPWSVFFNSPHSTHLVTSDPDIAVIQRITLTPISVSDYANHRYLPEHNKLSAGVKSICLNMLRGDKASTVDAQIALSIAELAKSAERKIDLQGARDFSFATLKSDDNFIFLGSPSSDPWFSVFNDQLDFQIFLDPATGEEAIRSAHSSPNEEKLYIPTARGGATGESFAIVAFVGNSDQYGQVLLLAGLNREGTQAAGQLVMDLPRMKVELQNCGITQSGPLKHFEMLLRVRTLASYPSQFDVIACHLLSSSSSR